MEEDRYYRHSRDEVLCEHYARIIARDALRQMGEHAGGEGSDLFACNKVWHMFMVEMLRAASDFEICCYIHGLDCGDDEEREETCQGSLDRLHQMREMEKQILALQF